MRSITDNNCYAVVSTYVAMQHYNDNPSSKELGASPAELDFNPESTREIYFVDHSGCPELRLWEDGFSVL